MFSLFFFSPKKSNKYFNELYYCFIKFYFVTSCIHLQVSSPILLSDHELSYLKDLGVICKIVRGATHPSKLQ